MAKEKHFLENVIKDKKRGEFLSSIHSNVSNISKERLKIGKSIQDLLDNNFHKSEIVEIIKKNTFLSTYEIASLTEEYYFNSKYSPSEKLSLSEIKLLKKIFKYENFSTEQQEMFIKQENLKTVLIKEFENIEIKEKNVFTHVFKFDEDGENLFQGMKDILNKKLNKKVSNSELIYYALIELYNSNPDEIADFDDLII